MSKQPPAGMESARGVTANEELQSINDELETPKEELESVNEELTTVNEEMANRNQELSRLNADLTNLQASTKLPLLLIGRDLTIGPSARSPKNSLISWPPMWGLEWNQAQFRRAAVTTPSNDPLSSRRSGSGRDRQHAGAGTGGARQRRPLIYPARNYAEAIARTARDPLLILRADLRVSRVNEALYKAFKATPDQTERRLIYELGNRQWDIPKLPKFLEEILSRNSFFNDFEVSHDFQDIGPRTMLLNARRLNQEDGTYAMVFLAIEDMTERKRLAAALHDHLQQTICRI